MKYLHDFGLYFIMLKDIFSKFTKWSALKKLIFKEIDDLIIDSLGIVAFISFFVGGVIAIQTALNIDNPLIPKYLVGFATKQSVVLEFAPTFMSIIMAGKVGSFITSSIGSMRVTEQIDALEIVSLMLYPFVITLSMFLGILGGWVACVYGGFATNEDFITGLQYEFNEFQVFYAYVKTFFFAFILATIPSFHGYYMKGGALEVGKAATSSFVWTSVVIIIVNYIITQLMLT